MVNTETDLQHRHPYRTTGPQLLVGWLTVGIPSIFSLQLEHCHVAINLVLHLMFYSETC